MHRFWNNGFNDMMNFSNRGSGWFIAYDLIKLLIIAVTVIFIARMFIKHFSTKNHSDENRAIEILNERYASGEISEEEYKNMFNKINE